MGYKRRLDVLVSIVIPCFNNKNQLATTVQRIEHVIEKQTEFQNNYELILVDDGSEDSTWNLIKYLATKDKIIFPIKGIRIAQNIGSYYAILQGMNIAVGEAIIVMAADGDDPPELIPQLISNYTNGIELVLANKKQTEKGAFSLLTGKLFLFVLKKIGAKNIPSGGSDFIMVSRNIFQHVENDGWKSGNTIIQMMQHTSKTAQINYTKGQSRPTSWSFRKKIKLFIQTINQFQKLPFVNTNIPKREISETC